MRAFAILVMFLSVTMLSACGKNRTIPPECRPLISQAFECAENALMEELDKESSHGNTREEGK